MQHLFLSVRERKKTFPIFFLLSSSTLWFKHVQLFFPTPNQNGSRLNDDVAASRQTQARRAQIEKELFISLFRDCRSWEGKIPLQQSPFSKPKFGRHFKVWGILLRLPVWASVLTGECGFSLREMAEIKDGTLGYFSAASLTPKIGGGITSHEG